MPDDGWVQLPARVRAAIEERAATIPPADLKQAVTKLSAAYRSGRSTSAVFLPRPVKLAAYLVTRMPATYAVARAVLQEVFRRLPGNPVTSVLDLGAGTGAASLAARDVLAGTTPLTMLEPDEAFSGAARNWLPDAAWLPRSLLAPQPFPRHDIVVACYSLGELPEGQLLDVAERAWQAAGAALVVIEPGSTRGFASILRVRDRLISLGARMIAPCPAEAPCPVPPGDWCHFGQRVERSSLHRRMKGADLGFEDEKFSYVALAKGPVQPAEARIVGRPEHKPGLITLSLCTGKEIQRAGISRSRGDAFRTARQARWGDSWPG
jgi:ribosomal protein RSM22 (predicted rRNA methylase)